MNLYTRRLLVNRFNLLMSLLATAFGLFWLAWILFTLFEAGLEALRPVVFTQMTPPPGSAGGLLNAIVGSLIMAGGATLARHADRHPGRDLSRRVRPARLARTGDAVHQRRPAQRAVDRDRAVRVHGLRRPHQAFLRARRHLRAGADRDSGRHPDDREHAAARARQPARGGGGARRPAMEGDHAGHAAGGARGRRHRRTAGGRAHLRRDGAAPLHRAEQPVLEPGRQRADGEPAGGDLPVRDEPLRGLAEAGLGRRAAHHAQRAGAQHHRAGRCSATGPHAY